MQKHNVMLTPLILPPEKLSKSAGVSGQTRNSKTKISFEFRVGDKDAKT